MIDLVDDGSSLGDDTSLADGSSLADATSLVDDAELDLSDRFDISHAIKVNTSLNFGKYFCPILLLFIFTILLWAILFHFLFKVITKQLVLTVP